MKNTNTLSDLVLTASAFAALGSEQRLSILRRLVRAGPDGLPIGELGEAVALSVSKLYRTHWLREHIAVIALAAAAATSMRGSSGTSAR